MSSEKVVRSVFRVKEKWDSACDLRRTLPFDGDIVGGRLSWHSSIEETLGSKINDILQEVKN